MAATPLLEAEALGAERAGRQLFEGLDLRLDAGDIVHLRGANGAGKTTLLRILAGLSAYGFDGRINSRAPILFLGHHTAVKGTLSCRENLLWHPSGERFTEDLIDVALQRVGLLGYEYVPASQLSAGQQRRVNLARLYLSKRPLWLLDEPFAAIDTAGVQSLQARFAEHAEQGGAVLLTSHQALDALSQARFVDLDGGPGLE
ncbi:MAG: cytochrome c biogenesis heme-transporting ATPase CcmA [Pseudomonadota bacterium]